MTASGSLRDIRLFVAAYEERSFTAAAMRENATQSGVSQHIRKLEESYGVRLFLRAPGSVMPTPAGDHYYKHCVEVLRAHHAAARALNGFGKSLEGELVIGLMPTMTRCVLAPTLAQFLDQNQNVVVRVVEAYSAVLTQQVRSRELDFAVVPAFAGGPGLKSRMFTRTPEVLVSKLSSRLPHHAPVRLSEYGPLKLVLPGAQNTRRKTLETYVKSNGGQIARVLELDAMLGTLDLVARTDWVAILPGIMMANDSAQGPFSVNPLAEPPMSLDLVFIESPQHVMSPAVAAFCAALEAETTKANSVWHKAAAM
jgi:LysR family nitrogen assimilation transcriptional regulator